MNSDSGVEKGGMGGQFGITKASILQSSTLVISCVQTPATARESEKSEFQNFPL